MKRIKFIFLFITSLMIFALASCNSEYTKISSEDFTKTKLLIDDFSGFTDSVSYYSTCSTAMTINKTQDGYYTYLDTDIVFYRYEYFNSQNKITKTNYVTNETTDYKTSVTLNSMDEFATLLNNELTPDGIEKKLVSINTYYSSILSVVKNSKNVYTAPTVGGLIRIYAHFIKSELDDNNFIEFFNSVSEDYKITDDIKYQASILVDKDITKLYPEVTIKNNGSGSSGTVFIFDYNTL